MVGNINKRIFFLLLIYLLIDAISKLIYKVHILNNDILLQYYNDNFSAISAEERLKGRFNNMGVYILLSAIFTVFKFIVIAGIINLGKYLFNLNNKIDFKNIFLAVIKAYYIFLIPGIIQIIYFAAFKEAYTVEDLMNFNWHTLLYWTGDFKYDFLKYPLSAINLYEILFWLILSILLMKIINKKFWGSFKLVSSTYGLGFLLWIVFGMFVYVSLS